MSKRKPPAAESEFLPRDLALRRTDELLHAMLSTPPHPHFPPKAPKKRGKK